MMERMMKRGDQNKESGLNIYHSKRAEIFSCYEFSTLTSPNIFT